MKPYMTWHHLLPPLHSFPLLWPPLTTIYSLNLLVRLLPPQGLCTGWALYWVHSSPGYYMTNSFVFKSFFSNVTFSMRSPSLPELLSPYSPDRCCQTLLLGFIIFLLLSANIQYNLFTFIFIIYCLSFLLEYKLHEGRHFCLFCILSYFKHLEESDTQQVSTDIC